MDFSVYKYLLNYFILLSYLTSNSLVASFNWYSQPTVSVCDSIRTCSQKCDVVSEQPKCSCVEMFHLYKDNKTCVPNDPDRLLIFATQDTIYSVQSSNDDFTDPSQQKKVMNIPGLVIKSITSDVRNSFVYGTNQCMFRCSNSFQGIFSVNSNQSGGEFKVLFGVGIYLPTEIAFDWITGNIYFVESKTQFIVVCHPDLPQCAKVINEISNPSPFTNGIRGLALHPNAGIMFWVVSGNRAIKKANMDGSSSTTIVSTDLSYPRGITVDETSSRIYWLDDVGRSIFSTRFDGSSKQRIRSIMQYDDLYTRMDVFGDILYWTSQRNRKIYAVNKFASSNFIKSTKDVPVGITVMHVAKQLKLRTNDCGNLQCSHVCALAGERAQCLCPVGMIINGTVCTDDETSTKLLLAQGNVLLMTRVNAIGSYVFEQVQLHPQIKAIKALVYNPINKSVIISEDILNKIVEYKMGAKEYATLVETGLLNVTSLQIDIVGQNLFWYDAGKLTLEVMSMKTKAKAILMRNVPNVHDMLFVHDHGALYISQADETGRHSDIRKLIFKGSQSVIDKSVHEVWRNIKPVHLIYDSQEERVLGVFSNDSDISIRSIDNYLHISTGELYFTPNYGVSDAVQIKNQVFWVDITEKVKVRTVSHTYFFNDFIQTIKINEISSSVPRLPRKIFSSHGANK